MVYKIREEEKPPARVDAQDAECREYVIVKDSKNGSTLHGVESFFLVKTAFCLIFILIFSYIVDYFETKVYNKQRCYWETKIILDFFINVYI